MASGAFGIVPSSSATFVSSAVTTLPTIEPCRTRSQHVQAAQRSSMHEHPHSREREREGREKAGEAGRRG